MVGQRPAPRAGLPRHGRGAAAPCKRCQDGCAIHCDRIRFTARCRARRSDLQQAREGPTPCPPTSSGTGRAFYRTRGFSRCSARAARSRPVRPAALQGGLPDGTARVERSAPKPLSRRRSSGPALQCRWIKSAVSPPNRGGS
jgi:hypothetical protein